MTAGSTSGFKPLISVEYLNATLVQDCLFPRNASTQKFPFLNGTQGQEQALSKERPEEGPEELEEEPDEGDNTDGTKSLKTWKSGDGPGPATQAVLKWKLFDSDGTYSLDPNQLESTFPPQNVYLSDWWVGRVIRSPLIAKQRCTYWPGDFSSKGYVLASRTNKGTPYKMEDEEGVWRYAVVAGRYELHGSEGSGRRGHSPGGRLFEVPGVAKENISDIEAGLARTLKRKTRKGSIVGPASPPPSTGRRTRQSLKPKLKPSRKIGAKGPSNLTSSVSSFKPTSPTKPASSLKPLKPLKPAQTINLPKIGSLDKGKKAKRTIEIEEDSQGTMKGESSASGLRKRQRIVLPPAADHNLFLISSDSEDNEVTKYLGALKDFLVHAEAYRAVATEALGQLKPLLKGNPHLRPEYDKLRTRNNVLVEEQVTLRGSLVKLMEDS